MSFSNRSAKSSMRRSRGVRIDADEIHFALASFAVMARTGEVLGPEFIIGGL